MINALPHPDKGIPLRYQSAISSILVKNNTHLPKSPQKNNKLIIIIVDL
jgi:hypothetical protein